MWIQKHGLFPQTHGMGKVFKMITNFSPFDYFYIWLLWFERNYSFRERRKSLKICLDVLFIGYVLGSRKSFIYNSFLSMSVKWWLQMMKLRAHFLNDMFCTLLKVKERETGSRKIPVVSRKPTVSQKHQYREIMACKGIFHCSCWLSLLFGFKHQMKRCSIPVDPVISSGV